MLLVRNEHVSHHIHFQLSLNVRWEDLCWDCLGISLQDLPDSKIHKMKGGQHRSHGVTPAQSETSSAALVHSRVIFTSILCFSSWAPPPHPPPDQAHPTPGLPATNLLILLPVWKEEACQAEQMWSLPPPLYGSSHSCSPPSTHQSVPGSVFSDRI